MLVFMSLTSFLASSSHWVGVCYSMIKSFWFCCCLFTSTVAESRVSWTSPILAKKLRLLCPLSGWTIDLSAIMTFSWVSWFMWFVSNLVYCCASEETRFCSPLASSFMSMSSLWGLDATCSSPSTSPVFFWIWFSSFYSSCLATGAWKGWFSGPEAGLSLTGWIALLLWLFCSTFYASRIKSFIWTGLTLWISWATGSPWSFMTLGFTDWFAFFLSRLGAMLLFPSLSLLILLVSL